MRIEHLASKPDRAGRYTVRFEGGSTLRLYRQTVEDFALYPGKELDDEDVKQLRTAAGQMSAKMRAVRIVAASNVSKGDLKDRLIRKGEDPTQAAEAVAWMEELSLVDDRETAAQIVSRCAHKGYGIARAKQALYEKRIPKEYWEDALSDYPDQSEKIVEFLRTRLAGDADDKAQKRAVDALLRRGHSYGDIRQALRRLELEFPEEYDG
ncbi:MAG: RecX family transcriptional regulator [Oscillospiraceae bacterium]|nr:RecX family transcriptional regulator [Oscillospiraceae bacterium]